MDLKKIKRLVDAIESIEKARFNIREDGNFCKVVMTDIAYIGKQTAQDIVEELNASIAPIVRKMEVEMRRQLALCAKVKE